MCVLRPSWRERTDVGRRAVMRLVRLEVPSPRRFGDSSQANSVLRLALLGSPVNTLHGRAELRWMVGNPEIRPCDVRAR